MVGLPYLPMNEDIITIARQWRRADARNKRELIRRIVKTGSAEGLRMLAQIVNRDGDVEIRRTARKAWETLQRFCSRKEELQEVHPEESSDLDMNSEEQIFAWLQSDSQELEVRALMEAQRIRSKNVLDYLRDYWDYFHDERVRATLVKTIASLGGADDIPLIYRFLEDANPRVRANAIEALDLINHPNTFPIFVQWLSDPDNRVKANCLKALRRMGGEEVNRILSDMLGSEYASYKESALYVIGLQPSRPGLNLLIDYLNFETEPDLVERAWHVVYEFAETGVPGASEFIRDCEEHWNESPPAESQPRQADFQPEELRSDDRDVVIRAMTRVMEQKLVQYGSLLVEALQRFEGDLKISSYAVRIIGELGLKEHVPVLLPFLKSEDDRVRANTVEAIGLLGKGREFLEPSLRDHHNRVKANAIVALRDSPRTNVIEALYGMVSDTDPLYRRSAVYAIRMLRSEMALSALEQLLYDADEMVRAQALEVLKQYEICGIEGATAILQQHGGSLYDNE